MKAQIQSILIACFAIVRYTRSDQTAEVNILTWKTALRIAAIVLSRIFLKIMGISLNGFKKSSDKTNDFHVKFII